MFSLSRCANGRDGENWIPTDKNWVLENYTDEPICRAEIEMQALRTDLWMCGGEEREGQVERVALTYIHYLV